MLYHQSSNKTPVFEYEKAAELYKEVMADEELSGELITSPWDLYSVETLRDRLHLRMGEAVPTDVFVFGKGEPDKPSSTKFGGRPFWPVDLEWPMTQNDTPCHFLAQFNFSDSTEIVGKELSEKVLLILTDSKDDWLWGNGEMSFHWISEDITPNTELNAPSTIGSAGPFYGAIYRSADYPDAEDAAFKTELSSAYNLPILNGTKIGGLPHFIQHNVESNERFLCQLGSVQAAPDVPYPWVNRKEALELKFDNTGIYGDENSAIFGDMGSIYLFIDPQGNITRYFESY